MTQLDMFALDLLEAKESWAGVETYHARLQQEAESLAHPIVDVVARDFNQLVARRMTPDDRYHFNHHRDYLRNTVDPGYLPGKATYKLNEPREGHCTYHQRFCPAVLTYECSKDDSFSRVKYTAVCYEAAQIMQAQPDENVGWKRYLRKWRPSPSILYKGEENMFYDDFCYWHFKTEGRRIQTREYTEDVVKYTAFSPMCDEAHEEIAAKGWYVSVWGV